MKFTNFKKLMAATIITAPLLLTSMQAHAARDTDIGLIIAGLGGVVTAVTTGDVSQGITAGAAGAGAALTMGKGKGKAAAAAVATAGGAYAYGAYKDNQARRMEEPRAVYYQENYNSNKYDPNYRRGDCVPGFPTSDCPQAGYSNSRYQQPNYNVIQNQRGGQNTRVIRDPDTGELVTVTVTRTGQYENNRNIPSINEQIRRGYGY